jgi:hypothetical protein
MARTVRASVGDIRYHVINRGNVRTEVFRSMGALGFSWLGFSYGDSLGFSYGDSRTRSWRQHDSILP